MTGRVKEEGQQFVFLTLRSLYQMLTKRDYLAFLPPVFDNGVFRGQTMVSFWRRLLERSLPENFDLSVFDTDVKRSRMLSSLLNRNGNAGMMKAWFDTLSDQLSEERFVYLASTWAETLSEARCDLRALCIRLRAYTDQVVSTDEAIPPRIRSFLGSTGSFLYESEPWKNAKGSPLYQCASYLAWLTLYALFGQRMGDSALEKLRMKLGPNQQIHQIIMRSGRPEIITGRDCALCAQPLTPERFFGREVELDKAANLLYGRGRLLVSGMGGIGKTEFVRQLLTRLRSDGVYQRLAFVQYKSRIGESLCAALGTDSKQSSIRQLEDARTLLMIDGIWQTPENDPDLNQLQSLNCDVLANARLTGLAGFDVLKLQPLGQRESWMLFADQCGFPKMDSDSSAQKLYLRLQGHPLALILTGRLCRTRYWDVDMLNNHMDQYGLVGLNYVQNALRQSVGDELRKLFDRSALSAPLQKLLKLLAILPNRTWKPHTLMFLATDIYSREDALCEAVNCLADQCWLKQGEEGYSMHPVMSASLRIEPCNSDEFPDLWHRWRADCEAAGDRRVNAALKSVPLEALRHTCRLNDDARVVAAWLLKRETEQTAMWPGRLAWLREKL